MKLYQLLLTVSQSRFPVCTLPNRLRYACYAYSSVVGLGGAQGTCAPFPFKKLCCRLRYSNRAVQSL